MIRLILSLLGSWHFRGSCRPNGGRELIHVQVPDVQLARIINFLRLARVQAPAGWLRLTDVVQKEFILTIEASIIMLLARPPKGLAKEGQGLDCTKKVSWSAANDEGQNVWRIHR